MKEEFDYQSVPNNFTHCFASQCAKAKSCLRNIAAQHITPKHSVINTLNPTCVPADAEKCRYFLSNEKIRVAWGASRLFDKIPYKDACSLRNQVISHFGRSKYYRLYRKEYSFSPEDQAFIRHLFLKKGVQEELCFDDYSEVYKW